MGEEKSRRPGRPRSYDAGEALERATEAFWDGGFSGTSLDDLTSRMGINRPSLYAAFGDKKALYLATLRAYQARRQAALAARFTPGRPLREALRESFHAAIDRYLEGDHGSRGCYLVGTAATEAVSDPDVREVLAHAVREQDRTYENAFRAAMERGELAPGARPEALATIASSTTHTLALRARAGLSRAALRAVADSAIDLICGPVRGGPRPH